MKVATVFALKLFFYQLFEAIRVGKETIVLHDLQLLALSVFADADVFTLEDFGAQIALIEVQFLASLSSVTLREGVLSYHGSHVLVDFKLGLLTLFFSVVDIFELVKVHGIEFEVSHVHLVFHLISCFLL